MEPRIYLYRITFEGRPEWYWGIHKEKKFDEYYMGSPCTHKEFWKLYTPNKEILKTFDYSEEGWKEANLREQELILHHLNDPPCLNESCGQVTSLSVRSEVGKRKMTQNWGKEEFRLKKINDIKLRWKNPTYRDNMLSTLAKARTTATQNTKLTTKNLEKRFNEVLNSGIDLTKEGWVGAVAKLWGLSHTQVRRVFDKYWEGPTPWKRKSPSRSCSVAV